MSLAYFDEPGLPRGLANIPLEYFLTALAVLRRQPGVDPTRVVVKGDSRGGEGALILASHYPTLVNAVIAGVPSSEVNVGYPDTTKPAWTQRGRPLPTLPISDYGNPHAQTLDPSAVIPVEKISGPILLDCGGQDVIWDSCTYMHQIQARLRTHHFKHSVTAVRYPDAGHFPAFFDAYQPRSPLETSQLGGTPAANQAAQIGAEQHLLAFLKAF